MHRNNFDFIRFILSFTVILAHIIDLSQHPSLTFLRPFFDSNIAVTGFFIISGFLISKSYISTNNVKQYFIKRANRLLPGYLFTVFCGAIFLSFTSILPLQQYFLSSDLYKYLFYNITFQNFLHPCLPGVFLNNHQCAVNGALWTIKVEVGFYIIIPFLIYIINKVPKKLFLFIFIYLAALAYKYICSYYYQVTGNKLFDILSHQLPAFMAYFVSGMAMHYYLPKFIQHKKYLLLIALPVFILEYYFSLEILKPLALTIIVFYVAYGFPFLNNFGKYGDFSYGTYIYHFPIIQLCITLGFFEKYNPFLIAVCIIITVLIMAVLSWNLLEKRFIQRKFNK